MFQVEMVNKIMNNHSINFIFIKVIIDNLILLIILNSFKDIKD